MDANELITHLTRIQTTWTLVFQAHQGQGDAERAAQQELLLRYYGAVFRYLLGTLRDPAAAEELAQEFAVRFLRGDFKRADPQRGRFRDFLKASLRHLVIDHWRRQNQQKRQGPQPLPSDGSVVADKDFKLPEDDPEFLQGWREELLARTWEALAQVQEETGKPYHAVLRGKTEQPQMRSARLAEQLAAQLGRPFTADSLRQTLHRSRKLFADLLVEEVARSSSLSEPDQLEQELIELGLLDYCQSALQRRKG